MVFQQLQDAFRHRSPNEGVQSEDTAFSNAHVFDALRTSDWFTPQFIEDVHNKDAYPLKEGLSTPFADPRLAHFFDKQFHLGKGNEAYLGVQKYVYQRMITDEDHPVPLNQIPFADKEFLTFARSLGVSDSYEVDRGMIGSVDNSLLCLIAPAEIRRPVVRVTMNWGSENVKRDTLLWADLSRRGAQSWLQRPKPLFSRI